MELTEGAEIKDGVEISFCELLDLCRVDGVECPYELGCAKRDVLDLLEVRGNFV